MLNNNNWSESAEYFSLIGSVMGSVVALFSGNAIYATVPICFALVFNTINRSRFEAGVRHNSLGINRLHRQVKEELDALERRFTRKQIESSPPSLGQQLVEEARKHRLKKGESSRSLVPDNFQIQKEIAELKQQYASLREGLNDAIAYLNKNALLARVERLESAIAEAKKVIKSPNPIADSRPTNPTQTTPKSNVPSSGQKPQNKKTAPKNNPKKNFPILPKFFGGESTATPPVWKCIHSFSAHTDWVKSIAISPIEETGYIASGSFDSTIKLWNLKNGQPQGSLDYHDRGIFAVAIAPDGKTLASTSWDKTIKLWELPSGDLVDTLTGHSGSVRSALFAHDGRTLISCSFDETIKLWDVNRGQLIKTLSNYSSAVYSLALHPNGKTLATGNSDGTISFWNLETNLEIAIRTGSLDVVEALIITPNGRTMISGNGDGSIQVWDLLEPALSSDRPSHGVASLKETLSVHKGEVTALAIAPDGESFASASTDGTVKMWHLDTLELLCSLPEESGAVMSLAMSSDGQYLVTGMAQGSIKIWQRG